MKTRTRDTEDKEKNADRLSNLPDCVILRILSFYATTKDALQTCILSKRWTNIWKRLPYLELASSQFNTVNGFALTNKFLSHVLSHRDSSTSLHHIIIHQTSLVLLEWLVELANTQSLSVNSTTLEVLSLVPDLLKTEPPSLCNLKSLKVKMLPCSSIPDGIVNFLCRKSSSAKVDIIDV
ncbi:F-box/FBD/LRR-repeat protein [Trifolium medium]|uniref:F-box/FBD/LRR-repeat protein n=1 Tax=Trifolium medium TaxID=97028 RepID=A0A392MPD5_9FABA|nr:F-box/FBD/LRR-repeat protein [Trifolium medium]